MKREDTLAFPGNGLTVCERLPAKPAIAEDILVHYLQVQDKKAITILYNSYSPVLYGVILRIVKNEMIAEDVLQECFVKIWTSFHLYNPFRGRLFTWLLNIARHLAIDKIRSRAYLKGLKTQPMETGNLARKIVNQGFQPEHIGIKELTNKLRPEHQKIIDLMYFEGYSQREIAEELNLPLGTVKTKARQAIQILRKLI